jgi:hypothetical protein
MNISNNDLPDEVYEQNFVLLQYFSKFRVEKIDGKKFSSFLIISCSLFYLLLLNGPLWDASF